MADPRKFVLYPPPLSGVIPLNFLVVAFVMFMLVRSINNMTKKKEEKPAAPPEIPADIKLLTDIRDLLKKQRA